MSGNATTTLPQWKRSDKHQSDESSSYSGAIGELHSHMALRSAVGPTPLNCTSHQHLMNNGSSYDAQRAVRIDIE